MPHLSRSVNKAAWKTKRSNAWLKKKIFFKSALLYSFYDSTWHNTAIIEFLSLKHNPLIQIM